MALKAIVKTIPPPTNQQITGITLSFGGGFITARVDLQLFDDQGAPAGMTFGVIQLPPADQAALQAIIDQTILPLAAKVAGF